ncbi:intracellular septation protein A [Gammaproteobacteria bacterium]|nr:intracellular septation protein A [Gammaproteobacteria bacterium]
MIQFLEFLPYLAFGTVYFLLNKNIITIPTGSENIIIATQVLLILVIVCSLILYFLQSKKLNAMQWVMLIVTILFASLTLLVDKEIIKWKVTIINSLFGLILIVCYLFKKLPLEYLLGKKLVLPTQVWKGLTLMWATFFIGMASINAYLILYASEATWVSFKSFWSIPITIVFALIQGVYLIKYLPKELSETNKD